MAKERLTEPLTEPYIAPENEWFITRLKQAGYTDAEARKMLSDDLKDAAIEDGMG